MNNKQIAPVLLTSPPPVSKPFIIYRSSAGSGKTYTLAVEYLTLALRQPTAYRGILAVTFTNKATQEMKSRIVAFLYELAHEKNAPLLLTLVEQTGLSEEEVTRQARLVLRQLLHGYSYFAVMTIDAFFQKVVRSFAKEVGLQAGFSIELDQDKVLESVIDELLLTLGDEQHKALRRWLIRFAEEKVEEGKAWDFRQDIKTLARELFKEDYRERRNASITADIPTVRQQLRSIQQTFEQRMQQLGQQALDEIARYKLSVEDFAYGRGGVAGYFVKLAGNTDYTPTKRVLDALEDTTKWYSKSSKQKEVISEVVAGSLHQILSDAVDYYQSHATPYYSAITLSKFIYTYGILHELESRLDTYKKEHDLMLISDAPTFLRGIIGQDDTPFIYEKIGTTFQNFLIDEFQDTSGLQWSNFRPLVEDSLGAGHRNLVVGDIKQSIYRWRGGDWQLLLERIQQDIDPQQTEVKNLDRNYRSRRNVIDFNNALFTVLPQLVLDEMTTRVADLPEEALRQRLLARASIIQRAYQDARQQLPDAYEQQHDWHGYVRLRMLDKEALAAEEDTSWKEVVKAQLPTLVEDLQDQGYALRDIAFLVRDKRDGREVVNTFMEYKNSGRTKPHYGYEVISSESLFLNTSLSVSLLVDLLVFLDNPSDALARGSIVHKYRRLQGHKPDSHQLHTIFSSAGRGSAGSGDEAASLAAFYQTLPAAFLQYQDYLSKLPIYELVENLVHLFELGSPNERVYLQAFQDAVLGYAKTERGDLHTFLTWWFEKGGETSVRIAEEVDAMRVLTIHKAKGLQFKVVILPFCDWKLDHNPTQTNILWTETEDPALQDIGLMPAKYSQQLLQTVFRQDYYEELIRVHIDNLNLLYVALTRAEEGLYAFAQPVPTKAGFPLTSVANALRNALTSTERTPIALADGWDEAQGTFTLGSPPPKKPFEPPTLPRTLSGYTSQRWRDRLMVRPASHGYFSTEAHAALTVNVAVLLKELLIRLPHKNELERHIQAIYYDRGITLAEKEQLRRYAARALEHPTLRAWYQPEATIKLQPTLLAGDGRYVMPDRVILEEEKAVVIGFGLAREAAEKKSVIKNSQAILQNIGYATVVGYWVEVESLRVKEL